MLVPALFASVSLFAQFSAPLPDEQRSPMSVRSFVQEKCKLAVGGNAWVGRVSVKGGGIQLRDLSGSGFLAAQGVVRFYFGGGRYQDLIWKHQTLGFPAASVRVTPQDTLFEGGLIAPTKAEGRVLGVYFGDGTVCGEMGSTIKSRHERMIQSALKDAEEAANIANALPPALFAEGVKNGLLKAGPYARESTEGSNALMRSTLLSPDGKLVGEYKQWLKRWHDSLKPARPAPQKQ